MLKILFKFIDIDKNEFRFIWDLNLSNANNVNKLLELSDSYSFENFSNKFETISFIFDGVEYKNIGKILEYIVYEEINDDEGISISNIIKMSNLFNKDIKEILSIIDYSNTCVLLNDNHVSVLKKIANSYNLNKKQYVNIFKLIKAYNSKCIDFINLTKIMMEEDINIIKKERNLIFYFIPLDKIFNKETTKFEKELEKYYNPDVFIFKINQEE